MPLKKFCYWQVTCAEDFENGKQKSWTCSAHAIEERAYGCPYSSLKDAKERRYPCVDAKPPEIEKEEEILTVEEMLREKVKDSKWIEDYVCQTRNIYRKGNCTFEGYQNIAQEKWIALNDLKVFLAQCVSRGALKKHIEKMKQKTIYPIPNDAEIGHVTGYNKALKDVLELLGK